MIYRIESRTNPTCMFTGLSITETFEDFDQLKSYLIYFSSEIY